MSKIQRLFDEYGVIHIKNGECINKHDVIHTYFDLNDDTSNSLLYVIDAWFPIMTQDQYKDFCHMAYTNTGTNYLRTDLGSVGSINPLYILMRGI